MTFLKKNIFVIDGLGALLSAMFLSFVMPAIPSYIGMPAGGLRALACLALLLALYSLSCYRFANPSQPRWLRIATRCNLIYCALTAGLVVHYLRAAHRAGGSLLLSLRY